MKIIKNIAVALISVLISFEAYAQGVAVTIPAFTFFKFDNSQFTNKNIAPGKKSLFIFFDATCDHCQHAMSIFNKHSAELSSTAIYLVSMNDKASMIGFMQKFGKNIYGKSNVTLLRDMGNEFILKFKPRKYPSIFLYSPQKQLLAYDDTGDEKSIGKVLQQVKGVK